MANPSETCSHLLEEETLNKVESTKSVFNEDLISRLPDEILATILSFVPTKTAVATSVLSKRWIRIWISVPNLDLGRFFCPSPDNSPVKTALFLDFVDRVLSLNNVLSVCKVYFWCPSIGCELSRVTAWISSLFRRDAEDFYVGLPDCLDDLQRVIYFKTGSQFYSVPDCFFNQNNLVKLRLENVVMKVPSLVWFPKLKTITFDRVRLPDDDSMKNLLSGCPVLRSLTMDRGIYDNAKALYFCSSTLDYLKLCLGHCGRDLWFDIVIDAPNLTHLDIMDDVRMNYNAINLPSLVKVDLDFEESDGIRLFDLLRQISHVKELALTTGIMGMKVHPDCAWYELLDVPQCYSSSVEFVEISCFEECVCEEEMGLIIYILKNAMVLKKLSISSCELDLVQETNILKSLLKLPKSSSACVIEYKNICYRRK